MGESRVGESILQIDEQPVFVAVRYLRNVDAKDARELEENGGAPRSLRPFDLVQIARRNSDLPGKELLRLMPRLWRACMQRRGAIRGGVEPVRRTTF